MNGVALPLLLCCLIRVGLRGKIVSDRIIDVNNISTYIILCIKMDLREIGWDDVDWVDLAQDRDHWRALVNTVMNLRVP
jgi:hypothetical protein